MAIQSATRTITVFQLGMLMFTTVGVMDHVIIIPLLLRSAKRDAWVSALLTGSILIVWTLLIYLVSRNTAQMHIGRWVKDRVHSLIWYPMSFIIIAQFFVMGAVTLRDTCFWAKTMYLPATPIIWIVLVFASGCYFASRSGIATIAISNGILLPIIVILGFFVAFGNTPNKNYSYLRPIFEHGISPVLHGMEFAGAAFSEMILVLFIQPFVKSRIRWPILVLISLGIVGLTMGPLMGAIAEFGPFEAARQRYTPYEEWRLLTFKHFIEHVDVLSIYQWLAGAFIRISLVMFLIPEMVQPTSNKKRDLILIAAFIAACFVAIYPVSDEVFLQFVSRVYLPASLISISVLFCILFMLSWYYRTENAR